MTRGLPKVRGLTEPGSSRRRALRVLAGLGGWALLPSAHGQQKAERIPRVAFLSFGSPANARSRSDAFQKGMLELGYVEGKNVRYEWRAANGQPDLLHKQARELAANGVDVVVSASELTTRELVEATRTLPIVMAMADDPVANGFARNLAHPGANVTGISSNILERVAAFVDLLAKAVPGITDAAALMNPSNAIYRPYRERLVAAAKSSRIRLMILDATTGDEIEKALRSASKQRAGGLVVMSDNSFYTDRKFITELASQLRIPAVYPQLGYCDAGGLIGYGQNPESNYLRAATFVDKILKGAKPADLPIEQPSNVQLVINRGAARAIGFTVPPDLLKRADKVIG